MSKEGAGEHETRHGSGEPLEERERMRKELAETRRVLLACQRENGRLMTKVAVRERRIAELERKDPPAKPVDLDQPLVEKVKQMAVRCGASREVIYGTGDYRGEARGASLYAGDGKAHCAGEAKGDKDAAEKDAPRGD